MRCDVRLGRRLVLLATLTAPVSALAQSSVQDTFDQIGFRKERNYFSPEPYEHYDTVSGNVLLTFTDLVLPGNAGQELRFQRTFNNRKGSPPPVTRWTFGLAGMVMKIVDKGDPPDDFPFNDNVETLKNWAPTFVTADGGVHATIYGQRPDTDTEATKATTMRIVVSSQFFKYDRLEKTLYMRDGTICQYVAAGTDPLGSAIYLLKEFVDTFGNKVEILRQPNPIQPTVTTVRQHFDPSGNNYRDVVLTSDTSGRVESMTFGARQWLFGYGYELVDQGAVLKDITTVTMPEGLVWTFSYKATGNPPGDIEQIITPNGGRIQYDWQDVEITPVPSDPTQNFFRHMLRYRDSYDRDNTQLGRWELQWGNNTNDVDFSWNTIINTPSGPVFFNHNTVASGASVFEGGFGKRYWTVGLPGQQVAESTTNDTYALVPVVVYSSTVSFGTPELTKRTVIRDGLTYTTTYTYDLNANPFTTTYGDYHHPTQIVETGQLTRTTSFQYKHLLSPPVSRYIVGLPCLEVTTVNGQVPQMPSTPCDVPTLNNQSTHRSWTYNSTTGFRQTETVAGLTTTFTPDAFGNVATIAKANGKQTQHTYSWGQVENTTTSEPGYGVTRVINSDGTVAEETQAGRKTRYPNYDLLGRIKRVEPPGSDAITMDYFADKVVTSRGQSSTTTWLNGFGRPIETENAANVRTVTTYDAEGRVLYQSLPFKGSGIGTGTYFTYDVLGRMKTEDPPGEGLRTFDYVANANGCTGVATIVRDEETRKTELCRSAFGHPDDTRLTRVLDAADNVWNYAYNVVGNLTTVSGPGGVTRTWGYDSQNPHLLRSETHPEYGTSTASGTVTYTVYDAAGVLKEKRDAKGTVFTYTHDANDRISTITAGASVTTITYETGSDNRKTLSVSDGSSTVFDYEPTTGRLSGRTETVDGRSFTTTYNYDGEDNLRLITYPSLRQVEFTYGPEHQLTAIRNYNTGALYASSFAYHESGAISGYAAGNSLPTSIGFTTPRYWISSIGVGGLQLAYGYDKVGNVTNIADPRPGKSQDFTYDVLDRLKTATAGYGTMQFDYDAHGNRQSVPGYSTYTYGSGKPFHLFTYDNLQEMRYDDNGNLESVATPGITMTYTPTNLMRTFTGGGTTATYAYDADDWRVKKEVNGGTPTYFLRGPNGQLLTEWTNNSPTATVKDYVYAGSRVIAVHESTSLPPK